MVHGKRLGHTCRGRYVARKADLYISVRNCLNININKKELLSFCTERGVVLILYLLQVILV